MATGQFETTPLEHDLATSEFASACDVADERGVTVDMLLDELPLREWMRIKAQEIVRAAQRKVSEFYAASYRER